MPDRKLNISKESHYTESVNWSKYMKLRSWEPKRIYFEDSNGLKSFIHFYFKSIFFISIVWIPYIKKEVNIESKKILKLLKKNLNVKFIYVRFRDCHPYSKITHENYNANGYYPCRFNLSKNKNLLLKINKDFEKKINRSWKRQLKSMNDVKHILEINKLSAEQVYNTYVETEKRKKLVSQYKLDEIKSLMHKNNNLKIFSIKNDRHELCALRGIYILNDVGYDIFAATTDCGLKHSFSHLLFFKIHEYLLKKNIKLFDFSGIDPIKNPGTYNFKKGTGANYIDLQGEYETTNLKILTFILSLYLFIKNIK